jgi:hypothetical protein
MINSERENPGVITVRNWPPEKFDARLNCHLWTLGICLSIE